MKNYYHYFTYKFETDQLCFIVKGWTSMTYWRKRCTMHLSFYFSFVHQLYFSLFLIVFTHLIHWGRVTHICVSNQTITGPDNGLSPGRRQAIIWTNAGILLVIPLGTNFSEILIEIHTFSFTKMHLKMSSGKWQPFCLGLNMFTPGLEGGSLSDVSSVFIWTQWKWLIPCWNY